MYDTREKHRVVDGALYNCMYGAAVALENSCPYFESGEISRDLGPLEDTENAVAAVCALGGDQGEFLRMQVTCCCIESINMSYLTPLAVSELF